MKKIVFILLLPGLIAQIFLGISFIWAMNAQVTSFTVLVIAYCATEIVISIIFYIAYNFSVGRPLCKLKGAIDHLLENKDLQAEFPIAGIGDVADLLKQTSVLAHTFDSTLVQIASSVARLEPMSRELTDTNMGLSQRNIIQRDHNHNIALTLNSVEESTKEMSTGVAEIMSVAEASNKAIKENVECVDQSYQSIHNLAKETAMAVDITQKLHDSSREIGNVVNLINTIAEQTNLLALNAAIEAARAGEAGRGFAVVADEVRNLSIKTQESTFKIEEMITVIQTDVDNVMTTMNKSRESSEISVEQIQQVKLQFDLMNKQVGNITKQSYSINTDIENQKALVKQVIAENEEMNVINEDIVMFTKESAISEKDLIGLGNYINQLICLFTLSTNEFDTSMRTKKEVPTEDHEQKKETDDDDVELF